MLILLVAFAVAAFVTLLLVHSAHTHGHRSGDRDFSKPQKVHAVVVPRIGGLAVVLGVAAGGLALVGELGSGPALQAGVLMLCAMPAFLSGFVQDFTDTVTPRGRMVATCISAALAFYVLDAQIRHTAIPGLDLVVSVGLGALVLTIFAVAGIAHAVNIIDGLNGLASMCVMLMLAAVAYVAFQVDDRVVALLALAGIGAVFGFFIWNFPSGLIFLGDGGAYFLGFYVAEVCILLLVRNPQVSPMFPLLVCIYPVFETVFSIYRRWVLRARPAHMPDGIHLHSLVYRRVMRWAVQDRSARALTKRNSMSSPVLWALCMSSIAPAMLLWSHTGWLAAMLVVFAAGYLALYWRIVRFRAPRLLRVLGTRPTPLAAGDNRKT